MKKIILMSQLLIFFGCAISRPLSGPGFDNKQNKLYGDPHRTVIIAITNALLDRSKRRPFDKKTQKIYKNIENYKGHIAGSIRLKLLGNEVWTYTIWENEAALINFVRSKEHLDAIYSTDTAIEKIRSLNIKVLAKDIPISWQQVEEIISKKEMKAYKVL